MGPAVMIIGVLLMVVIHEAGHFLAAKYFNMKATEAFFGFGPKLWSTQRGETEYGIKAIPLGGYVRIIGMNPFEEVDPEDEGRTYREKPFYQKAIVVLAGILSHFVVAYILFFTLAVGWGDPQASTTISSVSDSWVESSTAGDAIPIDLDLNTDRVVSIDGVDLASLSPLDENDGSLIEVVVERNGELVTLETNDSVVPAPALLLGLQPGDTLLSVNGTGFTTWDEFVALTRALPGETAELTFLRDGETQTGSSVLARRTDMGEVVGFLGVSPEVGLERLGVLPGLVRAGANVGEATVASAVGLGSLVTSAPELLSAVFGGDQSVLDEVRPVSAIGLTRVASSVEIALGILAWVNVFVGFLNVIPLYPLDGGHFAVALYEKVRGQSADVRKLLPVAVAVFGFIVVLGLLGVYFDIVQPLEIPG